ncbi:DUF4179 domain-containing protein [Namhaeicola litoreus]|uniref:DUF4179 domain-containing protein n=1 Tax=Namhaeicola litoreus TaxID=1052145 RepID=A0ABW3Y5D4_9FLAO
MKNNLEDFIQQNRALFDREEPPVGHFERFQNRLDKPTKGGSFKGVIKILPWLMAAASILLLVFVSTLNINDTKNAGVELAEVSPEMKETQGFFESTIRKEIALIEKAKNPENQKIIEDGFEQLNKLEENYQKLTLELKESGENKRVIFAMITNFQQRIEVLQTILLQLEELENFSKETELNKA